MKWENKYHQFDSIWHQYDEIIRNHNNKIYLFGAGKNGHDNYKMLHAEFRIDAFVDNDKDKIGGTLCELPILSLNEAKEEKGFIVVSVFDPSARMDIHDHLDRNGLKEGVDYCDCD